MDKKGLNSITRSVRDGHAQKKVVRRCGQK